jgi:hypothetical protein
MINILVGYQQAISIAIRYQVMIVFGRADRTRAFRLRAGFVIQVMAQIHKSSLHLG